MKNSIKNWQKANKNQKRMMKLVKIGKSSIKVNKKMWKTVKLTKNFLVDVNSIRNGV